MILREEGDLSSRVKKLTTVERKLENEESISFDSRVIRDLARSPIFYEP